MVRKVILFVIAIVICFFLGCNRQMDKVEEVVVSPEKTDDFNDLNPDRSSWDSIINKVWVKETWSCSEAYEDMSFVITKAEQGKLEGQFLEKGILKPDSTLYSEKQNNNMVLVGSYNEYKAELTLKDSKNIRGKLSISLENENLLNVDIQYAEKNTFKFKSYNLKDLEMDTRAAFDNDITDITLEQWGKIKFASVVRTNTKRKTLFIYLIDDEENILYDFSGSMLFPNDFKVNDFLFEDVNNDGREDLLLLLDGITDLELQEVIIYEQNKMGGFEVNIKKQKKINDKINEDGKYCIDDVIELWHNEY